MSTFNTYLEWEIEVEYTYHKGSKGAREPHGMQIEPDEPEMVEITAVTINGVDIQEQLSKDQIENLELKCRRDVLECDQAAREAAAEAKDDR